MNVLINKLVKVHFVLGASIVLTTDPRLKPVSRLLVINFCRAQHQALTIIKL